MVLDDVWKRFGERVIPVRLTGYMATDTEAMRKAAAGLIDAIQDFLQPSVGADVVRSAIMTLRLYQNWRH